MSLIFYQSVTNIKEPVVGKRQGPRVKRFFYERVACVCLPFDTKLLVIAIFMAIGFLIGVMSISFALPIEIYKFLWNSENGQFTKIFFQMILLY